MRGPVILLVIVVVVGAGLYFIYGDRLFPGSDPQQPAETAAASATDGGASSGDTEATRSDAEKYIEKLTESDVDPVAVEKADHFVTKDQMLSLLPEGITEEITPEELAADPNLSPDTPITVVKKAEQIEITTPEKIIAEAEGDLERKVRILEEGEVRESTARELLEEYRLNPDKEIAVIKDVEYFEITTPRELLEDPGLESGQSLTIIREPYSLEAATVAELLRERKKLSPDSVFYVRTVRPSDNQGIWGIVHDGIIKNFARGMAVRRGEEINTYQVEIPRHADEKLEDESSSFLGKMIHNKTMESYVYNFKQNRMGKNPDRVMPGQEIVIIDFKPEELIQIYEHFASRKS